MLQQGFFKIIATYLLYLTVSLIVLNITLFNNMYNLSERYSDNSKEVILKTVDEFNEIDLQHLCIISNCSSISLNNNTFKLIDGVLRKVQSIKRNSILTLDEDSEVLSSFNILNKISSIDLSIELNTYNLFQDLIKGYLNINILFFLLFTSFYGILEYKKRKRTILEMMNTSNSLREKNMQILTENVHHELNTPVAIIQGNIRNFEILLETSGTQTCSLAKQIDFGLLYSAIDQINNVLNRMSNFKNLKYSNGNKSLANILEYSANSMNIYKKANFNIILDDKLKLYSLNGDLKNGDLLSVVSNHFRNSLEAISNKIVVEIKFDKTKQLGHLFITDNGTGLRDRSTGLLLSKENYNDIFKPYYSSKDDEGKSTIRVSKGVIIDYFFKTIGYFKNYKTLSVRGVGLYLNKQLLLEKGGNVYLRETSTNGTVFEIIFKCNLKGSS